MSVVTSEAVASIFDGGIGGVRDRPIASMTSFACRGMASHSDGGLLKALKAELEYEADANMPLPVNII